jgi:hypothetical protein
VSSSPTGSVPWWDRIWHDIQGAGLGGAAGIGQSLGRQGGLAGIGQAIGSIASWLNGLTTAVDWLLNPTHWVRLYAGASGGAFVLLGIVILSRTGGDLAAVHPVALPLGMLCIGIGGVLLFVAFHNLPDTVQNFPSMLGFIQQGIRSGASPQTSQA